MAAIIRSSFDSRNTYKSLSKLVDLNAIRSYFQFKLKLQLSVLPVEYGFSSNSFTFSIASENET